MGVMDSSEREQWLQRHFDTTDWRGSAALMRHVFGDGGFAASGTLLWRQFDDHELFFDPCDAKIGMTLLSGRNWQRRYIDRAVGFLSATERLRGGGVFLDVGANIGCTAIYAMRSDAFGQAIAVEAAPRNAAIFKRNMAANGLSGQVALVEAAATDAAGDVTLYLDAKNNGRNSLDPNARASDGGTIVVPGIPVDQMLADQDVDPAAITLAKIDVEGLEAAVLAGMPDVLQAGAAVTVEVTAGAGNDAAFENIASAFGEHERLVVDLDDWLEDTSPGSGDTGPAKTSPTSLNGPRTILPLGEFKATKLQHELLIFCP